MIKLEQNLLDKFHYGLQQWNKKTRSEYKAACDEEWNVFRISSIGECTAKQTRDWKNKDEKEVAPSVPSINRMFEGVVVHETTRNLLRLGGATLVGEEREVRLDTKVKHRLGETVPIILVGHIDNIMIDGAEKYLVDYKKAERYSYDSMLDNGLPYSYYAQMMGYLACVNAQTKSIRRGIVFVRGTHGTEHTYLVEYDKKAFAQILDRIADVAIRRRDGKLAKREGTFGQPPCTWCPHSLQCWRKEVTDESVDIHVADDKKTVKLMTEACEMYAKSKEHESEAERLKGEYRKLAIRINSLHDSKKVVVASVGSVSWVTIKKKNLEVLKPEEAVKKGLARYNESEFSFPKFSVAKDSTEEDD